MAQQTGLTESQAVERIRRPKNAFILYSNENRRRVKELNKGVDNRGISKILGTQWKQLRRSEQFTYWRRALEERRVHGLANPSL
jgi:transcription factor SOX4/11/12 (SOX group C)